jgi:hypothetical protein
MIPAPDRGLAVEKADNATAFPLGTQASPLEPVGPPGEHGQPQGLPAPAVPGQAPPSLLPDILAGRDPSQLVAAERMRQTGAVSATDAFLGLDKQPPIIGAFAPPPGNSEALRHMTPTMRRAILRALLAKQRERSRRLALLLRRERGEEQMPDDSGNGHGGFAHLLFHEDTQPDEAQRARARDELSRAAWMLDLLDELLVMQDYTLSQMGTFSQG